MAELAILQIVDRCVRCRGCMVACSRNMGTAAPTSDGTSAEKVTADDLMVIKSQAAVENAPYARYSCWHCTAPPCQGECPFGAIIKQADGAVTVDHNLCNPNSIKCSRQCLRNCMRGGYPKIGFGDVAQTSYKAWKCNFCYEWSQASTISKKWVPGHVRQAITATKIDPAASDLTSSNYNTATSQTGSPPTTPHTGGVPACVQACPAGALKVGYKNDILAILERNPSGSTDKQWFKSWGGAGSVYWGISAGASDMMPTIFAPPAADPFIEDHVSPMVQSALSSPAGKALVLPTLATAGLYALYKRKVELAESK